MTADTPKPPTEAGLAAIQARADKATPGPWFWDSYCRVLSVPACRRHREWSREVLPDGTDLDAVTQDEWTRMAREEPKTTVCEVPRIAGDTATAQGGKDAEFIAHARTDVLALLAAVEERDHLIWIMSQDQEAYRRGVEDGRRDERRETTLWLQSQPGRADGVVYRDHDTVRAVTVRYQDRDFFDFDPPPPLPPDRARTEYERLRGALRAIALLKADDDSPAGVGMTLVSAQRTARAALLGESS